MMERDNSLAMARAAVEEVKRSVQLDAGNQQTPGGFSGHSSAPYGSGPSQAAAVPSGSPGTGRSGGEY